MTTRIAAGSFLVDGTITMLPMFPVSQVCAVAAMVVPLTSASVPIAMDTPRTSEHAAFVVMTTLISVGSRQDAKSRNGATRILIVGPRRERTWRRGS